MALTVRFFIRWFLMRRVNHSFDVWPVMNLCLSSGAASTAAAIMGLSFINAFRRTLFPGRVKNTWDQRSCRAWAPGGELRCA